jgi:ketosteroid isomerase-like protein
LRFQAVEKVPSSDSEHVLVVLEQVLRRGVSYDVERSGSRIILSGLGPSPRTINRMDTTVIDVRAENGMTLIDAKGSFLASALLGPTGQEEIVLEKLERIFDAAKEQLRSERERPRPPAPAAEVKAKLSPETKVAESATQAHVEQAPVTEFRATREASQERVGSEPRSFARRDSEELRSESSHRWILWTVLGAVLLSGVPFAIYYVATHSGPAPVQEAASVVKQGRSANPATSGGPEDAVRQWELAMRSSDAGSQAAYYAIPVDQYMWKHKVSGHDLQTMKQAEISRRRGLWTVKLESVNIKRNGDTAVVTLTKHIMEQPPGMKVRERLVHSELTLKNSLGIWLITSERDLVPRKRQAEETTDLEDEGETPDWARPSSAPAPASTPAPSSTSTPSSSSPPSTN